MTIFSPLIVGSVDIRAGRPRAAAFTVIRLSCGRRRSEMSSSDMIFSRDTSDWCSWCGIWIFVGKHAVDAVAHDALGARLDVGCRKRPVASLRG